MRKILIRKISALPNEFSIQKYRALNSLKKDSWYQIVSTRFNLDRRIRELKSSTGSPERVAAESLELLANPIPTNIQNPERFNPEATSTFDDESINQYGIRPINFFTAFSIAADRNRYNKEIDAFERYLNADCFTTEDSKLLRQPLCLSDEKYFTGRALDVSIEISLALPDQILIHEFKSWLKSIRQELKIIETVGHGKQSNELSDVTIGLVKMSKAIPYIDLRLWATLNGYRISPEVYTDALGLDDVKRLENTTKWVKWVLNPRTVDALCGEFASKAT